MLHPLLQRAVTTVTSVREASVGVVTMMMRDDYENDLDASDEHLKKRKAHQISENARLAGVRAIKANEYMEVKLVTTAAAFKLRLRSFEGIKVCAFTCFYLPPLSLPNLPSPSPHPETHRSIFERTVPLPG